MQTATTPVDSLAASGVCFENLSLGSAVTSEYRIITQDMIQAFADLSGDDNPLHLNEAFATATKFRGIIAHGALVLAVVTGLASKIGIAKLEAFFTEINNWKFLRPVRPGDSIRLSMRIEAIEPLSRNQPGKMVTFCLRVENQRQKTVQEGSWTAIITPRETEANKADLN